MDIANIGTSYAGQLAQNALSAEKTGSLTKKDYTEATDDELMNACKQFEEYFVEQVFKEAQKTIMKDDSDISSSDSMMREYYEDGLAKEIATIATERESFGLAKTMYEQMKRSQGVSAEEVLAAEHAPAEETAAEEIPTEADIAEQASETGAVSA